MKPFEIKAEAKPPWFWFVEESTIERPMRVPGVPNLEYVPPPVYYHPTLDYSAHHVIGSGASFIEVTLPLGDKCDFAMRDFPKDSWENLVDSAGNDIPLRIWVHYANGYKVAGAWRTDVAGAPTGPPPPPGVDAGAPLPPTVGSPAEPPPPPVIDAATNPLEDLFARARERNAAREARARMQPDAAFNERGVVLSSFRGEPSNARALRIQPDGRIIVAGTVGSSQAKWPRRMAVARYLPDGRLDEGFGEDGWAVVKIRAGDDRAHAVALQDDGKIVIAGESLDIDSKSVDFALARLNEDGSLDKGFNGVGFVLTGFGGPTARAYGVAIDDDGKIVAGGYNAGGLYDMSSKSERPSEFFAVARYEADGTLDETFGDGNGLESCSGRLDLRPYSSEGSLARAYALTMRGGLILAAGRAQSGPEDHADFAVMRFDNDGVPDPSFWGDGRSAIDLGVEDNVQLEGTVHAVSVQENGKIVLAGAAADKAGEERYFALARLDDNGELDQTFDDSGIVVSTDVLGEINGVAIEPDGAIVAAGYQMVGDRDRVALARYDSDGWLHGLSSFDLGGVIDRANDIAIDDEGRILYAGTTRISEDKVEFAVARLLVEPLLGFSDQED